MNQEDFTFINYTRYFNYKDSFTIMSDIANRQDCTIQLQEATVVWLVEIWKKIDFYAFAFFQLIVL